MDGPETMSRDVPLLPYVHELIDRHPGKLEHDAVNGSSELLRNALCALLHPDVRHLTPEHKNSFNWTIHGTNGDTLMRFHGPRDRLSTASEERLVPMSNAVVSGIVYYPQGDVRENPQTIRTVLERTGIIDEKRGHLPVVLQGGARISEQEGRFAEEVGYHAAVTEEGPVTLITGSGGGIMEKPMIGAKRRQDEEGVRDALRGGMSCGMIIAAEPTNEYVNGLALFPDMEKRLEGFTRTGLETVIFPGGAGTAEELLFLLAVALDEKNKDRTVSYLLAGAAESKPYFDAIIDALNVILGKDVVKEAGVEERLATGKAKDVARRIKRELLDAKRARTDQMRRNPEDTLSYSASLSVNDDLRHRFQATRENVLDLRVGTQSNATDTLIALRRAMYTITCVTVGPERKEAEKAPYVITATERVKVKLTAMLESFIQQGRLNGDRFKDPLFKFETI